MGYVAIQGGEEAITNAAKLTELYRVRSGTEPLTIDQIRTQFRFAVDKVMGEGSLYAPEHAALALKQMEGDLFEASFSLRAYRATLKRDYHSEILDMDEMFVERRVSSLSREIPGGQILGPTRDFEHKFLKDELLNETVGDIAAFCEKIKAETPDISKIENWPPKLPKVTQALQESGILRAVEEKKIDRRVFDVTREAVKFPAPRSATMQMLARAETGALTAMAYSSMRGFGEIDPVVGELRVGKVPVRITDRRGRRRFLGRIRVTEAEMLARQPVRGKDPVPYLSMGYGLCFGQVEEKAISMGILDRTIRKDEEDLPPCSQEFVLYHSEGVESYGFTNHLKLPHYVTFQSGLNQLRQAVDRREKKRDEAREKREKAGAPASDAGSDMFHAEP